MTDSAVSMLQQRRLVEPNHTRETLLQCENVTKSFGGIHALKGVTLDVKSGEILALVGPKWIREIDVDQYD